MYHHRVFLQFRLSLILDNIHEVDLKSFFLAYLLHQKQNYRAIHHLLHQNRPLLFLFHFLQVLPLINLFLQVISDSHHYLNITFLHYFSFIYSPLQRLLLNRYLVLPIIYYIVLKRNVNRF